MSSLPSLRLSDQCYGEVFRLAVGGHLAQLVATLEQERCKGGGFQLTPATLLPDPTASPPRHSPLVQAAYSGHLEVVQYLISQAPTPNFINHTDAVCFRSGSVVHHCSPLLAAVLHGMSWWPGPCFRLGLSLKYVTVQELLRCVKLSSMGTLSSCSSCMKAMEQTSTHLISLAGALSMWPLIGAIGVLWTTSCTKLRPTSAKLLLKDSRHYT